MERVQTQDEQVKGVFRLRLRVFVALAVGLLMTGAISYFIWELQTDRLEKIETAMAQDLAHSLQENLSKNSRLLAPITGQIDFNSAKKISRDLVLSRLEKLKPLIGNYADKTPYRFLSWVPVWVGRNNNNTQDIVAVRPEDRERISHFLTQNQGYWESLVTKPAENEGIVFGLDLDKKRKAVYLVIGQPFFQTFDFTGQGQKTQQFPLGYLIGWLDISGLMRSSWDGRRQPQQLIFLRLPKNDTSIGYLTYQSGLVEVNEVSADRSLLHKGKEISFNLGGKEMLLRVVPLEDRRGSVMENIHWFVLGLGVFSTILWCFLLARISRHTELSLREEQEFTVEDVSRKLEKETEKKRVIESVLKRSEARWNFVAENLPVALFAVDSTGMFTLGEGKGLEAFGLTAGAVEGNSIFDVFGEHPNLISAMRECLGGEAIHDQFHFQRHHFDMRFSPVMSPDGRYEGMICVATDVTAETNMRERLDKVNLRLRGLMDNLPTGVAFVRGGVIQWCSRHFEEMFDYEQNELSGRSPELLYSNAETFRQIEEEARNKLLKKQTFRCKVLFKSKKLSRFIGEMTGRLVDQNNMKAGTMWVVQDLSGLLEEAKEKRLSQAVFDNIVEGILICNAARQIVSVNKAFCSITGYSESEALGNSPSMLSSGRHSDEFYQLMWKSLNEKGKWEGEIWNKRKNGEDYLQWLTIKILEDEDGEVDEYVAVFSDITKHRRVQEQLNYQSNYDQLTGLPNRHLLADRFAQVAAQANRENKSFALVYFDLDNFKYLNESLGHECGDEILKIIAERLDNALRSSDTVARISGDEFILLLMGAGQEDTISRIVANLSMQISMPLNIDDHEGDIVMSASCGIAIFPDDGTNLAELTRKADSALDHAKKTERGLFSFFTEEMNVRAKERLLLEHKLRRAIEQEHLVLYYQPKVDVENRSIYGAEALIRWHDPELGMIGPDRFIPLAEETGLIIPLGEWVFRQACAQFKQWQDKNYPISNIAVNLSGRQFTKPDLAHELIAIIHAEEMDPNCLEIEITESFIANNEAGTIEALNMFSKLGVKLSVDDFGTGYSSLNYLHRFPLDVMKIDRSFIMDIEDGNQEIAGNLAKAVIAIAHSMNLKLVGEGVENEAQLDFLKENGCHLVQGFYFSKPIPAEEFEVLLQNGGTL